VVAVKARKKRRFEHQLYNQFLFLVERKAFFSENVILELCSQLVLKSYDSRHLNLLGLKLLIALKILSQLYISSPFSEPTFLKFSVTVFI
jgi:hypothetical protein